MAAGLGFKTFAVGEVLTAADTNGYLMQGVLVFASAAARDAAITSPQEGQFAYLKDTNVTTYYTGSAWANLDTTGMTNPMTTTGDMVYSSSGSTPARLGVGSTGNVLTVAGGVPTWAAPAGGGGSLTYITSATASGTATTLSINNCFSATYVNYLILSDLKATTGNENFYFKLRASGTDSSSDYYYSGYWINSATSSALQTVLSSGADTNFRLRDIGAEKALHNLQISNPFASIHTTILTNGIQSLTSGSTEGTQVQGAHAVNTSYDGCTFIASTNLTGTVRVYGYSNS